MKTRKIISLFLSVLISFSLLSVGFVADADSTVIDSIVINQPAKWEEDLKLNNFGASTDDRCQVVDGVFIRDYKFEIYRDWVNGKISDTQRDEKTENLTVSGQWGATLHTGHCYNIYMVLRPAEGCTFAKNGDYYTGSISIAGVGFGSTEGMTETEIRSFQYNDNYVYSAYVYSSAETIGKSPFAVEIEAGDLVVQLRVNDVYVAPDRLIDKIIINQPAEWQEGLTNDVADFGTPVDGKCQLTDVIFMNKPDYQLEREKLNGTITEEEYEKQKAELSSITSIDELLVNKLQVNHSYEISLVFRPSGNCVFPGDLADFLEEGKISVAGAALTSVEGMTDAEYYSFAYNNNYVSGVYSVTDTIASDLKAEGATNVQTGDLLVTLRVNDIKAQSAQDNDNDEQNDNSTPLRKLVNTVKAFFVRIVNFFKGLFR